MISEIDIAQNLKSVQENIPSDVRLVAISKFHPASYIQEAYKCGQRLFGESREQELAQKAKILPHDVLWHFIGHLQTNKVKYIAPYIEMIESVDSLKLLKEIDKQAQANDRKIKVLLELHIAQEEAKYGFSITDCRKMLDEGEWKCLKHVEICGLMTMATNTDDAKQIHSEFTAAYEFFKEVKEKYFLNNDNFRERSWGMSHDYKIAIACNATMVRIGTSIFGPRIY